MFEPNWVKLTCVSPEMKIVWLQTCTNPRRIFSKCIFSSCTKGNSDPPHPPPPLWAVTSIAPRSKKKRVIFKVSPALLDMTCWEEKMNSSHILSCCNLEQGIVNVLVALLRFSVMLIRDSTLTHWSKVKYYNVTVDGKMCIKAIRRGFGCWRRGWLVVMFQLE